MPTLYLTRGSITYQTNAHKFGKITVIWYTRRYLGGKFKIYVAFSGPQKIYMCMTSPFDINLKIGTVEMSPITLKLGVPP